MTNVLNSNTHNQAPMMSGIWIWEICIKHQAFGTEGLREYAGTERGARIAAGKMAKRGGHGWRGVISALRRA